MEYKEFANPEDQDYDVNMSLGEEGASYSSINSSRLDRVDEMVELVGILEDGEWETLGMTEDEYLHPTDDVLTKVRNRLAEDEPSNEYKFK